MYCTMVAKQPLKLADLQIACTALATTIAGVVSDTEALSTPAYISEQLSTLATDVDVDGSSMETADEDSCPFQQRQPTRRKKWQQMETFNNKKEWEAHKDIKERSVSVVDFKKFTADGAKTFYHCVYGRKRGWHSCPWRQCILMQPSGEVTQSWNGCEHNQCEQLVLVANPMKCREVNKIIEEGLKPSKILMKIDRNNLSRPTKRQLYNKVAHMRRTKGAPHRNSQDL